MIPPLEWMLAITICKALTIHLQDFNVLYVFRLYRKTENLSLLTLSNSQLKFCLYYLETRLIYLYPVIDQTNFVQFVSYRQYLWNCNSEHMIRLQKAINSHCCSIND